VAVILFTRLRVLTVESLRYVMTLYFISMIIWLFICDGKYNDIRIEIM